MDSQEQPQDRINHAFGALQSQLSWKPPTALDWQDFFKGESGQAGKFASSPYGTLDANQFQPLGKPVPYTQFDQLKPASSVVPEAIGVVSDCDTAQQFPSGKPLKDTCGIELADVYEEVKDSVARLERPKGGNASAFALCSKDACGIISNEHVVRGVDMVSLRSSEREDQVSLAKVIDRDPSHDVALLKVIDAAHPERGAVGPFSPVLPGQLRVGEPFFQVGHPLGRKAQVVAPGLFKTTINEMDVMQTDRSIRHFSMPVIDTDSYGQLGGSGSPGFNKRGRAVGVVFAVSEFPDLTGARTSVVPIIYALRLLEKNRARLLRPEAK